MKKRHTITVTLNGTNENPWYRLGVRCNPFPQIAKCEWDAGQRALNELDGDPLAGPQDIRTRLDGKVSRELIELCVAQFIPGQRVEFNFTFEE
jgi:hypothetical protein